VTRAQIEAVRGVDCSGVLRSLMQRGLVAEVGRLEGIGRPILYGVTELFMQRFGLMEMGELPPLEETEADRLWAATVLDEQELDGR
jgi:segregation and condensation protein B